MSIRHAPGFPCCLNNRSERPGGGFTLEKGTIAVLIGQAYRIDRSDIRGLPEWATNEAYDIVANGNIANATADDRQKMKQALLADRFMLKPHVEVRDQRAGTLRRVSRTRAERRDAGPAGLFRQVRLPPRARRLPVLRFKKTAA